MPATAIRVPLLRVRLGRLDDARLAALAAQGDERAFEALYDRHHRPLLGFCRHMAGSREEGEDALQQTFLRAHRALLAHGPPDEVKPWLFAIARNRCLSLLAARRADAVVGEEIEPATEGFGAVVERRADLRALLADVRRLPEDQRSALVLAELADLSHAEIATVIGVPPARVKALVHQARSRLIAERDARETPCEHVREQLATARGGALRRGPLRRHLGGCEPCRAYRDEVARQRAALGLALPVLPSAGLKDAIFGALTGGGGAAGTTAAAGGAAAGAGALSGGGSVGLVAKGLGAKLAIGAALAGGAGGGAVAVERIVSRPAAPVAADRSSPAPAARRGGSGPAPALVAVGDARRAEADSMDTAERDRPRSRSRAAVERARLAAAKAGRRRAKGKDEQRAAARQRSNGRERKASSRAARGEPAAKPLSRGSGKPATAPEPPTRARGPEKQRAAAADPPATPKPEKAATPAPVPTVSPELSPRERRKPAERLGDATPLP